MGEIAKREIVVTKENREFLKKLFGCTEQTLYNSLDLQKPSSEMRKRIRKAAMERGGDVMVTLREMETIHDSNGMMIQTFPNGARIEISKKDGDARIIYKGEEVATFENVTIASLYDIQSIAHHLGKQKG